MDRCLPEELQQPSARDMKLLGEILTDLPQILAKAKSEFEQFENPSFIDQIDNPTIWISCGDIQWQPKWAWVIERLDHPSYGCHIEFEGLEFKEIWAGD
jgi:hypothetical protein